TATVWVTAPRATCAVRDSAAAGAAPHADASSPARDTATSIFTIDIDLTPSPRKTLRLGGRRRRRSVTQPGHDDGAERVRDDGERDEPANGGQLHQDVEDRRADERDERSGDAAGPAGQRRHPEERVAEPPGRGGEADDGDQEERGREDGDRHEPDLEPE